MITAITFAVASKTAAAAAVLAPPTSAHHSVAAFAVPMSQSKRSTRASTALFARGLAIFVAAAVLLSGNISVAEAADTCSTKLYAAGRNEFGQFGNGADPSWAIVETFPILIEMFGDGLIDVSAGYQHSAILKADRTAWTAGKGVIGSSSTRTHNFTKVDGVNDIIKVVAGPANTFFITASGEVFATGRNSDGRLGDQSLLPRQG